MDRDRDEEKDEKYGDERRSYEGCDLIVWAAYSDRQDGHKSDGERHVGGAGQALAPEMIGAVVGGAESAGRG